MPRVLPKARDDEPLVECITYIWHRSGSITPGQRLPLSHPIVREEWRYFRHPARPVHPDEVNVDSGQR
jgi:hypothetical protein